jgi:uncharacterized damage-inducible protein DinB
MKNTSRWALVACLLTIMSISFSFRTAEENMPSAKTDALVKDWERAKAYTKEYLDAGTEAAYAFKPTPEMRTFGEQMMHIAEVNYVFAGNWGKASPIKFGDLEKGTLKSKADVTKTVLDSYDFMIASIKGLDDAKLQSSVKIFNMDMTIETALNKAFEHQTHHRGQTTVYLRLSGLKPPAEKLF